MAKRASARKTTSANKKRAKQIVRMWNRATKEGLGGKRFANGVQTKFGPRFEARIAGRLDRGETFTRADERKTKKVAKDVGAVCAMLADGAVVSRDVFEDVFRLLKKHAACPALSLGSGTWCEIPLV